MLEEAVSSRNGEIVQELLNGGVSAARIDLVKVLIGYPVPDAILDPFEGYHFPVREPQSQIAPADLVRLLVTHGGDVNQQSCTQGAGAWYGGSYAPCANLLNVAIDRHRPELAKYLLAHGADVNGHDFGCCIPGKRFRNWDGTMLPLVHAIVAGDIGMVRTLLAHGARINRPPHGWGNTSPAEVAAEKGDAAIVRLLLRHGADPFEMARAMIDHHPELLSQFSPGMRHHVEVELGPWCGRQQSPSYAPDYRHSMRDWCAKAKKELRQAAEC